MLIYNAKQLLTLAGDAQRGENLGNLGVISNGAVLIRDGLVEAVGRSEELLVRYPGEERFDAGQKVVMPGFVDPHTHLIFSGDRAMEFEMRLEGKTYQEIMAAGGGIVNTVRQTRSASLEDLVTSARGRMCGMLRHGTTSAEAKTGYGLDAASELLQLQTILKLAGEGGMDLFPTWMAAHAIPNEYANDPQGYTDLIVHEMLTKLHFWWQENASQQPLPFVDVFCEVGAFSLTQSRQILQKAKALGFPLKIHADEFENLGGASLAAELGAASADHLVKTSDEDIRALAKSDTVAVALPATPFGLGQCEYTPAQKIIAANGLLAIASDLNPGTAWCENMQFVIALSCRYLKLTVAQAIAAATINAAAAVNRQDLVGSLEPGKQADILLLAVDDYRQLGYKFGSNLVHKVMKRGQWVVDNQ
jgi:imidazolonepropionase